MEKAKPLTHQQLQQIFNKYDANGDGKISLQELTAILTSLGSATTAADEAARAMSELDSDGDGFIDFNEFKAFHCRGGDRNKELEEAFELYDKDKNGKISASELHDVLGRLGDKCSLKDCRRMIGSVDVDGDGCVNFDEFKRMMGRSS
ncbi:probable calcium-binding protein CML18 [Primulina huaijiensis]|uniref:probable calcium-binding protein CML18 n=1 Tax=Primulina huaijiensis TaxID=1492673 RepID=UPI003CC7110D